MKKNLFMSLALAGLAVLSSSSSASASIFFTSTTTVTPATIPVGGTTITLSGFNNGGNAQGLGTDISFAQIIKNSSSPDGSPDSFNQLLTFGLTVTDTASSLSHVFNFTGTLGGSASVAQSNLTFVYDSPTVQSFNIGGNIYIIDTTPGSGTFSNPGNGASSPGSFGLHITANPPSTGVPEPATFFAALLGVVPFVIARRRRLA